MQKHSMNTDRRCSDAGNAFSQWTATILLMMILTAVPAQAGAARETVEYMNFSPDGRIAILEREARVVGERAALRRQNMDRDMIVQIILQAAAQEGQDPALVLAVAMAESRLDPFAVSSQGATGLMQLMPATARRFGCRNLYDVYQNAAGGARYLGFLLNRYDGNTRLALAAYNAGPAPVDRLADIPPFGETQAFVQKVLRYHDEFRLELP
ncbi:MAG: lytic transglycosylase domain-containing protein [Deltaproteobacteria bacterium]|nr:lytic transglycosylase domain-containing protein [Deltaproteobacteria bacterium]